MNFEKRFRRVFSSAVLVTLVVLIVFIHPGYAFFNGQAATLVLGQTNFSNSVSATTTTGLSFPSGASFDGAGDLWVADWNNNRILEYVPPFTSGMAASLVLGQPNFTSGGYATTASGLQHPAALTFDSNGNLWVADANNARVLEYTCTATSNCQNGNAATLVLGQSSFTAGPVCPATSQTGLCGPSGVAFDSHDDLWVSDMGNNRVLEYVPPFSSGMAASLVLGQSGFTSDQWAVTQKGMDTPAGLMFDSQGNLWVADAWNNRVLEFVPPFTTGMAASLVLGQSSFTTRAKATSQTGLHYPDGLSFDRGGNLWMSDELNNRVLEFVPPFTTGMAASLVLGQGSFTTGTSAVTQTGLSQPEGLSFDGAGDLWVADSLNSRVLEYVVPPTLTLTPTSGPPGTVVTLSGDGYVVGATYSYCLSTSPSISCVAGTTQTFTVESGDSVGWIPSGTTLTVPFGTVVGSYYVVVYSGTPAVIANYAPFTVPAKVYFSSVGPSPGAWSNNHGWPGATVYVSGSGYTPSGSYSYCMSTSNSISCVAGTTSTFTTDASGNIPTNVKFTVPSATPWGIYYIVVYSGSAIVAYTQFPVNPLEAMWISSSWSNAPYTIIQVFVITAPSSLETDAKITSLTVDGTTPPLLGQPGLSQYGPYGYPQPYTNATIIPGSPGSPSTGWPTSGEGVYQCGYQAETPGPYMFNGTAHEFNATVTISLPSGTFTASSWSGYHAGQFVQEIHLVQGWNLISTPLIPGQSYGNGVYTSQEYMQIVYFLWPLWSDGKLGAVWSYQNGKWVWWSQGSSNWVGASIRDGMGYWILMYQPADLFVGGSISPLAATPPSYSLNAGWNCVGFKPPANNTQPETVGQYLSSITGKYTAVTIYNNTAQQWVVGNPNVMLYPGQAMWIYMATPAVLVPQ